MSRAVPKRRASSQERIDRILEATISLLGQGGLSELSIYAIAEQAEIPPSSVYHFFPQISDVLAALAERLSLMLIDRRRTDAMGEAGRAFALEAFNLQKQSRKLETYLMDLAGKAGTL